MSRKYHLVINCVLFLTTLIVITSTGVGIKVAQSFPTLVTPPVYSEVSAQETAQHLFEAGQYQAAIAALEQHLSAARSQGDLIEQAIALSNLSLNYQHLGNWQAAEQHVTEALTLVEGQHSMIVRAQVLDVRGSLELLRGQATQAITTWTEAIKLYQQSNHWERAVSSQINLAQALQQLGLSRRAVTQLSELENVLSGQPDSLLKLNALRALGEALRIIGDLPGARTRLQQSLEIATRLSAQDAIAQAYLSLGNLAREQAKLDSEQDNLKSARNGFLAAISAYDRSVHTSITPLTRTQASLNHLNVLLEVPAKVQLGIDVWAKVPHLYRQIQVLLPTLPPGRTAIRLQVGLAHSLIQWRQLHPNRAPELREIAQLLAQYMQHAKQLNDPRALATATGYLGWVYEQAGQWAAADRLTQAALMLAQANHAPEQSYQ